MMQNPRCTFRPEPSSLAYSPYVRYNPVMAFGFPEIIRKMFVVSCKRCSRDVPAGVQAFPFASVVVSCPLCGEVRRYRPSEVFLGVPNQLVERLTRK
jgi:hypothetical protein